MNQMTPWSSGPPGCAPCFDPAALLACWCDIQATTALINKVVLDQIQTNPAYAQAIAAALAQSGAALPLVGVTNGVDAQPGQVGEFIEFFLNVSFPATASNSQTVSMGVLQPGDWDCWAFVGTSVITTGLYMALNPTPAGFSNGLAQELGGPSMALATALLAPTCRALTTVPSLIQMELITNTGAAGTAGTAGLYFIARRRR